MHNLLAIIGNALLMDIQFLQVIFDPQPYHVDIFYPIMYNLRGSFGPIYYDVLFTYVCLLLFQVNFANY